MTPFCNWLKVKPSYLCLTFFWHWESNLWPWACQAGDCTAELNPWPHQPSLLSLSFHQQILSRHSIGPLVNTSAASTVGHADIILTCFTRWPPQRSACLSLLPFCLFSMWQPSDLQNPGSGHITLQLKTLVSPAKAKFLGMSYKALYNLCLLQGNHPVVTVFAFLVSVETRVLCSFVCVCCRFWESVKPVDSKLKIF